MRIELGQVVTQIISFLIMLWVLKRYAWKPILGLMEERKNKIASEFNAIEEQKKEVDRLTEEYQEKLSSIDVQSRAKMQEAVEEGRQKAQEIQKEAHEEAKDIIVKAREDVQREVVKGKAQLKNELINIALTTTEKMIQESLGAEKQKRLVAEFVDQADFK